MICRKFGMNRSGLPGYREVVPQRSNSESANQSKGKSMSRIDEIQHLMEALGPASPAVSHVTQVGEDVWAVGLVEDSVVFLELDPEQDRLVLTSSVGRPRESDREKLYEAMLGYNALWRDYRGRADVGRRGRGHAELRPSHGRSRARPAPGNAGRLRRQGAHLEEPDAKRRGPGRRPAERPDGRRQGLKPQTFERNPMPELRVTQNTTAQDLQRFSEQAGKNSNIRGRKNEDGTITLYTSNKINTGSGSSLPGT
jgi:hypothetical protein